MRDLRPLLAAATLAISGTVRLPAQAAPADTSADVLVLDYDFTSGGGGEYARVFLEARQVYRAELNSSDASLVIRAVGGRIRAPRVYPVLGPDSPSEASVVELYPDHDAVYEIRPVADGSGGIATRLRVYRDVRASHRRMAVLSKPAWGIGFEVAGGWFGGFSDESGVLPATPNHTGSMVETCFSARPPRGGSLCVFGLGYQSQAGSSDVLWFFTEPRARLIGVAAPGQSGWEAGALLRAGFGSIERVSRNPFVVAPGVYVARQIRSGDHGGGWTFQGSYSHGFYSGFGAPGSLSSGAQPHSDGFTIRLGWYQ